MRSILCFLAALSAVAACHAQTATVTLVQWSVSSHVAAGPLSDGAGSSGATSEDPFFRGASNNVTYFDGGEASAYAEFSADVSSAPGWLGAAIYGYAATTDEGPGAAASGSSFIEIDFHVAVPYQAKIRFNDSSSKGYLSLMQKWNGTSFDTFLGSDVGSWTGMLGSGTYRWVTTDHISLSGSTPGEAFSHTMSVQAVPEPATLAGLAMALGYCARRRRR